MIDTATPEFYAVMASLVQLWLARLHHQLDRREIDIRASTFQDFLTACARLDISGKRRPAAGERSPYPRRKEGKQQLRRPR